MSGETVTILFDHLLLIEGLLLGVGLGAMLLWRRYVLNRRAREADREGGLDTPPAPEAQAASSPEPARGLRRVR